MAFRLSGLLALILIDFGATARHIEDVSLQVSLTILTMLGLAYVVSNEGFHLYRLLRAHYRKLREPVKPSHHKHRTTVRREPTLEHDNPLNQENPPTDRPTVH